MAEIKWQKVDHFTGQPYKKDNKSGDWHIIDYVADDLRISEQPNGDRLLIKNGAPLKQFKTLKDAKAYAETL